MQKYVDNVRKRALVLAFVVLMLTLFAACNPAEVKDITCEDIIKAYEEAGYYVTHGEHKTEEESPQLCYVKASLTEDEDSDYIYFITCFTEAQAEEQREVDRYNVAVWFYAAVSGEARWLKTGTYGKIEYSYYNSKLIKPFKELIK